MVFRHWTGNPSDRYDGYGGLMFGETRLRDPERGLLKIWIDARASPGRGYLGPCMKYETIQTKPGS